MRCVSAAHHWALYRIVWTGTKLRRNACTQWMETRHPRRVVVRWAHAVATNRAVKKPVASAASPPSDSVGSMDSASTAAGHTPVLLDETVLELCVHPAGVVVDGTFGAGGHSSAILERYPQVRVLALDCDATVLKQPQVALLVRQYGSSRFVLRHARFSDMRQALKDTGYPPRVHGILLDLGVSSMQLDQFSRGFSFRPTHNGPLDMRMDHRLRTTAADIVNGLTETDLVALLQSVDEHHAVSIAAAIVRMRRHAPFFSTGQLAAVVRGAVPRQRPERIDPCTKTFMALRMAVNDEMGELRRLLHAAPDVLLPGGRLCVISFHSGEHTLVRRLATGASPAFRYLYAA